MSDKISFHTVFIGLIYSMIVVVLVLSGYSGVCCGLPLLLSVIVGYILSESKDEWHVLIEDVLFMVSVMVFSFLFIGLVNLTSVYTGYSVGNVGVGNLSVYLLFLFIPVFVFYLFGGYLKNRHHWKITN